MNRKKRICVISFSNLRNDPRVRRQLFTLKDTYDITALGLKESRIKGISDFVIPDPRTFLGKTSSRIIFLFSRLFKNLYKYYIMKKYPTKEVINILKDGPPDLIIANGLDSVLIAHSIAKKNEAKILFDAHEYEPKRIEDHWFHKLFVNPYKDYICRNYLSTINFMTTSSYGFAKGYRKNYGVEPEVILNAPAYKKINLKKVNPNNIKLIHHGVAHPSRELEIMIRLMPLLDKKFNLTLMLVGQYDKYTKHLKSLSTKLCPKKVTFREPVSVEEIVPTIARYDLGLVIIKPSSFKLKYTLPNKLFESIMAGLCVVSGPSPDMKKIVKEYDCGFIVNSFNLEDIATMLNSLRTKDITEKKNASLEAAKVLNAENEMRKFKEIVKNLIGV
jgi:glycosyltransferase involved in cell wall biosynthesis